MKIKFNNNIQQKRLVRIQRGRGYKYVYWINDEPYFDCPKGVTLEYSWSSSKIIRFTSQESRNKYFNDMQLFAELDIYNKCRKKYKEKLRLAMPKNCLAYQYGVTTVTYS